MWPAVTASVGVQVCPSFTPPLDTAAETASRSQRDESTNNPAWNEGRQRGQGMDGTARRGHRSCRPDECGYDCVTAGKACFFEECSQKGRTSLQKTNAFVQKCVNLCFGSGAERSGGIRWKKKKKRKSQTVHS